MAREHFLVPTAPTPTAKAVRLGAGAGPSNNLTYLEDGKIVKVSGESRYDLAAVGNEIEGIILSGQEGGTQNGFTIGSIVDTGRAYATADGIQATPGTGTIAIGDYVVTGTVVAKGTALGNAFPKVCKATAAGNTLNYKWRVVSLGTVGTGAVGTQIVIERI